MSINQRPLKVSVIGAGPDLVLLHGWAMHSEIFSRLATDLAGQYRLHLVDLPGHGQNHALPLSADLGELAAQIAEVVPPAAWLGWSLGGLIALQAALDGTADIQQLILLSATPAFVQTDNWPIGMQAEVFLRFAEELETDYKATLQRFLAMGVGGSKDAGYQLRRLRGGLSSAPLPTQQTLLTGLDLLRTTDLSSSLSLLQLPVMLIGGGKDQLITPLAMRRTRKLIPDARLHILEASGHTPFIGQRRTVVTQINDFLREHHE